MSHNIISLKIFLIGGQSQGHDLPGSALPLWRRQWHPTAVLLPGKSHGWRSLEGCSPWGCWGSNMTERLHFHALEKEMATHSSVLAWRIPGTGEPGGLPSMGSHRVAHDWSTELNWTECAGQDAVKKYFGVKSLCSAYLTGFWKLRYTSDFLKTM